MNESKLITLLSLVFVGGIAACSETPAGPDMAASVEQQPASPAAPTTLDTTSRSIRGGRVGSKLVIYVYGQGLFYDSIVGPNLPHQGRFQTLEMGGPTGRQTEFGPGDSGYLGGRWWVDVNGNGQMDGGDSYFSCPLLGPGREEP